MTRNAFWGLCIGLCLTGTQAIAQKMESKSIKTTDKTDSISFHIDGITEGETLFTVIGGPEAPVINAGMPGTEGIQGGFEGGSIVKINGVYHMFPTERAGVKGMPAYHDRVKTRIGHWTSTDAVHWTRQSTILESSGVYALVHEDNPMNDRRSAIWSYMPVFSEENNRWYGFYLAYTTDKEIAPNHSFGRIWRCESEKEGLEGIGGPYRDMGIMIEPGLDSQLWEGRQGVASFFPYKVDKGWNAFISGAYPYETRADYPLKGGEKRKVWAVGLAESENLEGPWKRMGEEINPITSIHPQFVENPIVSRLPNGTYIAMFDGGPDYLNLPNRMGYTLSIDGKNWSKARYIAIDTKVKKWWTVMRTPLCLIPEGNNVYTIVYTVWDDTRFHPIGMVKVKLNPEVLDKLTAELKPAIPYLNEVGAQAMPRNIVPIKNPYFNMPQLKHPVFPDFIVNMKGKGMTEDAPITDVVNRTIAEVSKQGGGTVVIPEGKWKSTRIVLKSNVNLHLAKGAEIEFAGRAEDYLPAVFTRHEGIEIMGPAAFIYANGENNIAITGEGTIYGPPMDAEIRKRPNGASVVEKDVPWDMPIEQRIYDGMEGRTFYRPKTISPINCTNVLIEGITMERSTLWNVVPIYCENVIIRGITVNSTKVPSGDGIDIESCKNVLIEYCTLNCGDDCFTLKAGRAEDGLRVGKPTENVVIRYSLAQHGHGGITCGSETAGVIKNLYVHDCVFDGTRTGIRFKTRRNRGGGSDNTYYERLRMINVGKAFTWDLLGSAYYMGELAARYPARKVNRLTPDVKNILIKDFIVESADQFFTANGIPEIPFNQVVIENGEIKCKKLIGALNDAAGFTMRKLTIESLHNDIHILDGKDILFEDIHFKLPAGEIMVNVEGERSGNIVFKNINANQEKVEYKKESPMRIEIK